VLGVDLLKELWREALDFIGNFRPKAPARLLVEICCDISLALRDFWDQLASGSHEEYADSYASAIFQFAQVPESLPFIFRDQWAAANCIHVIIPRGYTKCFTLKMWSGVVGLIKQENNPEATRGWLKLARNYHDKFWMTRTLLPQIEAAAAAVLEAIGTEDVGNAGDKPTLRLASGSGSGFTG